MNPAIPTCPVFESREHNPDADDNGWGCDCITHSNTGQTSKKFREFNPNAKASSMGMYLTNPPCRQACIQFVTHDLPVGFDHVDFSTLLEMEAGITVGALLNFASELRGFAILTCIDPHPDYDYKVDEAEEYEDMTMNELLERLNHKGPIVGRLRCDFLDTIIPTDRMRAGVAPYVETGGPSKYSEGEGWGRGLRNSGDSSESE